MSTLTKEEIVEYSTKVKTELLPALRKDAAVDGNNVPDAAELSLDSLENLNGYNPEAQTELSPQQKIALMLIYAQRTNILKAENPLGAFESITRTFLFMLDLAEAKVLEDLDFIKQQLVGVFVELQEPLIAQDNCEAAIMCARRIISLVDESSVEEAQGLLANVQMNAGTYYCTRGANEKNADFYEQGIAFMKEATVGSKNIDDLTAVKVALTCYSKLQNSLGNQQKAEKLLAEANAILIPTDQEEDDDSNTFGEAVEEMLGPDDYQGDTEDQLPPTGVSSSLGEVD